MKKINFKDFEYCDLENITGVIESSSIINIETVIEVEETTFFNYNKLEEDVKKETNEIYRVWYWEDE